MHQHQYHRKCPNRRDSPLPYDVSTIENIFHGTTTNTFTVVSTVETTTFPRLLALMKEGIAQNSSLVASSCFGFISFFMGPVMCIRGRLSNFSFFVYTFLNLKLSLFPFSPCCFYHGS
jgi:hypothetical protein